MADAQHTVAPGKCPEKPETVAGPPLFQNGNLTFQAHHVGWIVASFFALIAIAASIWLINKHLTWYTNRLQQRQIVRLLLMVPIYATISCLAYFFWNHAIPLSLIRDAYEGIILAAFFYLLLQYLAPTPAEQKEYFRTYTLERWAWPFGWVKRKPDGLYFLQLMKWAILQYCWVRPLSTFAAVILNMAGIYCETSWSPRFGSVWILIIVSISVTIAMFCLIQFYLSISDRIKHHKPLLQLFSIKAIIFLMFWQSSFLSVLHSMNVIKDTKYMTAEDINVGFAALLQTFEMVLFAFLHVKCFSYLPYRKTDQNQRTKKAAAFRHALDFRDFWKETRDGIVYMWRTVRGKEPEIEARRRTHFERAMGRNRDLVELKPKEPPNHHFNDADDESESESTRPRERPLLNIDRGPSFTAEFEKAATKIQRTASYEYKEKKGRRLRDEEAGMLHGHDRRQRSWWSRFRDRMSNHEQDEDDMVPPPKGARERGLAPYDFSKLPLAREPKLPQIDLDEPPPPSLLGKGRKYSGKRAARDIIDGLPTTADRTSLLWDPITVAPPVPFKSTPSPLPLRSEQIMAPEVVSDPERSPLRRKDTLLGRLFARSFDTESDDEARLSSSEKAHKEGGKRKVGVSAKPEAQTLIQSSPSEMPLSPEIPTIPSPSPMSSPTRPPVQAPWRSAAATNVISPIVPAHPIPIPHESLSRPGILKADAEGRIPPLDPPINSRPRFQEPVTRPRESTSGFADGSRRRGQKRGPPPSRGPRRPEKLVMPTPLSPARFPGYGMQVEPFIPPDPPRPSQIRPGQTFPWSPGPFSGRSAFGQPASPPVHPLAHHQLRENPYGQRFPSHHPIQFGEELSTPSRFNPIPQPIQASPRSHHPRARRDPDFHPNSAAQTRPRKRNKRSNSPFGISDTEDGSEPLPRHPAMRQQTARRRRESQPLPDPPIEAGVQPDRRQEQTSRHHSMPLQGSSFQLDSSNSPPERPSSLLGSPHPPSSPGSSPHGDSRYPRATARTTYFDDYETATPYLTNVTTSMTPPEIPVLSSSPFPSPIQSRRLKRR